MGNLPMLPKERAHAMKAPRARCQLGRARRPLPASGSSRIPARICTLTGLFAWSGRWESNPLDADEVSQHFLLESSFHSELSDSSTLIRSLCGVHGLTPIEAGLTRKPGVSPGSTGRTNSMTRVTIIPSSGNGGTSRG